jgi:hydrogenase-4 component B
MFHLVVFRLGMFGFMTLFLTGLGLIVAGGLAALLLEQWPERAGTVAAILMVTGAAVAAVPALLVLPGLSAPVSCHWNWAFPGAGLDQPGLRLDPLSAIFLLPVLTLTGLGAVYGRTYWRPWHHRHEALGLAWLSYGLLGVAMALVATASHGVVFLVVWELMTLTSWFLVTFENEKPAVRSAGWLYLVASHIGNACLLALFCLLARNTGSWDFSAYPWLRTHTVPAAAFFLLALAGFGVKAGLAPLHVWLPEAHPAAPSHVSAVMSGAMIAMGIYGLLRILSFLDHPAPWWGWLMIGLGLGSALFGALLSLAQSDLKRLLAYSSVENMGLVATGIGFGLLGQATHQPALLFLGYAGALLHVLNHALFKGLLFFAAGAAVHAVGSRSLEAMGGLLRRMPETGALFILGAAAAAGLPPLNGFTSEFFLYLAGFRGLTTAQTGIQAPALIALAGLALTGVLAGAAMAKAAGVGFLGEPRSEAAANAHEPGLGLFLPMLVLALGCLAVPVLATFWPWLLAPATAEITGMPVDAFTDIINHLQPPLAGLTTAGVLLLLVAGWITLRMRYLLKPRPVRRAATWTCGYLQPTPRMQYTAGSFAQPMITLFRGLLRPRYQITRPAGLFPAPAAFACATPDVVREHYLRPLFHALRERLAVLRAFQEGHVQVYILYITLTLLILLLWKL